MGLKDSEPKVKSITSAADFDKFISGRSLYHMRMRRPDVVFERGKAKKSLAEAEVEISLITDLNEALAAMAVPGTYLGLFDTGQLLAEYRISAT